MEQWRTRRVTPETKAQFSAPASQFLWQISQFLYQAPVSLAAKEISRGTVDPGWIACCMVASCVNSALYVYVLL